MIQVCNQSLPIAALDLSVTTSTFASCLLPALISSGLYATHAIYHQAEPEHNVPNSDSNVARVSPAITVQTPMDSSVVTHLKNTVVRTT